MGNLVNLSAFLVLTALTGIYLFRYSARVKDPLNSKKYLLFEGSEYALLWVMATSTLALSGGGGGQGAGTGFNLQAIRLMVLEIFFVLTFFIATRPPKWGIGTVMYLIYLLWITYTLTYAPSTSYGFRYILKYIYPFLTMLACSAIVRDEKVFLSICVWMRRIALVSVLLLLIPIPIPFIRGLYWYSTALNMHYPVVACCSLVMFFYYGKDWKDLAIALLFFLPCILEVHRTGLLCIFVATAIFFFMRFKLLSLPFIALTLGIGVAIIFYVPSFHEKMFWKTDEAGEKVTVQDLREGNISEDDIRNNGRKALWKMLEANFYKGHELKGSGIGSCQYYLYEHLNGVKQTHGDYIQMRCDTGKVGMWLFIAIGIAVFLHCLIVCLSPNQPDYVKACAAIAASSVVGQFFAMYSDNAVTYTMCTTGTSFAFYGMMLGLKAKACQV